MTNHMSFNAIVTKYHGPTNHRGARVSANCAGSRMFVPWDHALNIEENHVAAALAMIARMDWQGRWVNGGMPDGRGFVFVRDL